MPRLYAFVNLFVDAPEMDNVMNALSKIGHLEELYEVTGEFDIITLVSAKDMEEFRDILKNKIMKIKGIKSTVSSVALKVHKGSRCDDNKESNADSSSNLDSPPENKE